MTLAYFPDAQPLEGLIGGLMIGIAAAIMLLGLGRIAGASGLAGRSIGLSDAGPPRIVASMFIAGLILGALLFQGAFGPFLALDVGQIFGGLPGRHLARLR